MSGSDIFTVGPSSDGGSAVSVHPVAMTAPHVQPPTLELGARPLAGYRVLRSLAHDEGAEVLLGHRIVTAPPAHTSGGTGGEADGETGGEAGVEMVALKVSPNSDGGWEVAVRECSALDRARGEHVVELLDMDADEESIRLVFERLPGGDLAELLRLRARLDAGEAVTLLAPIAVTILRLHAAGVAHGNLSARTVLFRDDGSPTLIGFSHAEIFEPGAPEVVLERVAAVRHDRAAARMLAAAVLGRVAGSRARAARELRDDVEGCDVELVLPLLASRLFEVAAAMPVRFSTEEPTEDEAVAGPRLVPVAAAVVESPDVRRAGGSSRVSETLGRLVPEPLLRRVIGTVEHNPAVPIARTVAAAAIRRWRSWTPARRRIVLAVGVAALTIVSVTAVVPAGTPTKGSTTVSSAGVSAVATPRDARTSDPDTQTADPALSGDDPVAASFVLLRTRDRCLSSLSVLCLDRVDEAGSGALEDDRAAIRAAQQGAELPDQLAHSANQGAPVLVERLGDSALVRVAEETSAIDDDPSADHSSTGSAGLQRGPASLLLVKGEAGWRIRDVIAARGSVG